jgi:hypothetical protein
MCNVLVHNFFQEMNLFTSYVYVAFNMKGNIFNNFYNMELTNHPLPNTLAPRLMPKSDHI